MEGLDLTKMVQTSEEKEVNVEQTLDLSEEENVTEEINNNETNANTCDIVFSPMVDWFENNSDNIENVKRIKAKLMGIDPDDSLLFSVKSPKGGVTEEGDEKRELYLFKNSKNMVIPNITPLSFDVYSNGFRLIYDFENVIVKCYILKTNLIMVYCFGHNNALLPFLKEKVSKNCKGYNVNKIVLEESVINSKLSQDADLEALQIKYPQMRKEADKIKTNEEAVSWILDRQSGVYDVNHLLQLDDLIIDIMR